MKYSFHIRILKLHEHKNDWLCHPHFSPKIHSHLPLISFLYCTSHFLKTYRIKNSISFLLYRLTHVELWVSTVKENAIFYHSSPFDIILLSLSFKFKHTHTYIFHIESYAFICTNKYQHTSPKHFQRLQHKL